MGLKSMLVRRMNQATFLTSMIKSVDQVDCYINNEDEKHYKKIVWEAMNKDYIEEQAAKEAAVKAASEALKASNSNCPEHARKFYEATIVSKTQSRKEKQQKKAEEEKNAAPPATTIMEAVRRTLVKKRLTAVINDDVLQELFDTSAGENPPKRSKTETDMEEEKEEKSDEPEIGENEDEAEEDEEGYVESYDMNTKYQNGEKFYEEEEEEEEEADGYNFGLY